MMWCEGISEGAHVGTTTHQGAPGGPSAPMWVVPTRYTSLLCYLHQKFLNIQEKKRIKFSEHSENFYFWVIFLLHGKFRKQTKLGILFN